MEFVITWVRKKTRHGFIHYIWDKLKQGISIRSVIMTVGKNRLAGMGSFYLIRMVNELMKYEASMPLKFDTYENGLIKCKAFCTYHQKDFDSLTEDQKQFLFEHHYRNFIVSE
jgi:hypothetical protein